MKKQLLNILLLLFLTTGNLWAQNSKFDKDSAFNKGLSEYIAGNLEVASKIFDTYLENVSDSTTAQYAVVLHKRGNIAMTYGNYQESLQYYETALRIRRKIYGKSHPECASLLINIGCALQNIGRNVESLDYLLQGAEMDRKFSGAVSQFYGEDLHNIGNSYYYLRDYANAEKYYTDAAKIKAAAVGENDFDYATTIGMLASLYSDLGENETAIKYYMRAAKIIKATEGKEDTYANILSSLGTVFSTLGNYTKAQEKYEEAKRIIESLGMEKTILYTINLNNIASAYYFMHDYDKALEIDRQVVEIARSSAGENTPVYATGLNNIGTIYTEIGEYDKALDYLCQAAEIRRNIFGENNIEYAKSLTNIGNTLMKMGSTKASIDTLVKACEISESVFGKGHHETLDYLLSLASCYMLAGEYASANTYLQKSFEIGSNSLRANFSFLSARERELYWQNNMSLYRIIVENSFHIPDDASASARSYDAELITKGLLLTSEIEFNKLIAESKDLKLIAEFENMRQLGLMLNAELEKPISERIYNCDSLEKLIQRKEHYLVMKCRQYGDFTHSIAINWKDVHNSLAASDVAIEFTSLGENTDTVTYAAIVLTKDMESPVFVPLFNDSDIARLIRGIAPAKHGVPNEDENRGVIAVSSKRQGIYESTGLYRLIWQPLEKYFPENPRIYFAPTGTFHQIAVEYAPLDSGKTISDKYEIYRVSSTRFLAMDYTLKPLKNTVLYGGIYYDSDTITMKHESNRYLSRSIEMSAFSASNRDESHVSLCYLPGTKIEVEDIAGKLKKKRIKTTLYEGSAANEESFKALSGKDIEVLHIATHGFFLPSDEKLSGDQSLVYSGLLLSGANYAWQNKTLPEGIEDGILTAKEISFMDLRKTDLVVLSACQTALGEITGEGVFGLQRGFKKAGARTIIMSLWPVDDNATLLMMTEFYTNLTKGMSKREAFLAAQNKVKTTEGFENPRFWAAFIMLDGNE